MKKGTGTFYGFVILFLILSLSACQGKQSNISSEEIILELITSEPITSEPITSKPEETSSTAFETTEIALESEESSTDDSNQNLDKSDFSFADLSGLEFWYSSGAGAWSTIIQINPDGTFDGYYHDSNAGESEDEYPNGTRYECYFSGKFTSLQKVGEFEYSMRCESLLVDGVLGDTEIIDGVLVVTSDAYGFENADEFLLYLPDKKLYGLPEYFLMWVGINPDALKPNQTDSETEDRLSFYGLYNVGGETGFKAYSITEQEMYENDGFSDFEHESGDSSETNGLSSTDLIGEYTDDNGDINLIIRSEEDRFHVEIGIFRLTHIDDGVGILAGDKIIFTATDASGEPISGEIIRTAEGADVIFTDSTWAYIFNGDMFRYYR